MFVSLMYMYFIEETYVGQKLKKKIFTKFCPEMDSCLKKKNSHISLFFMCQSYEPNYCNFCKQSEILSFQKVNDYFVLSVINNISVL